MWRFTSTAACPQNAQATIVSIRGIEAWMIADEKEVAGAIPSLSIPRVLHPETIRRPKEWLVDALRKRNSKPLYTPAISNPRVARMLDLDVVAGKCPSFRELVDFVRNA